VKRSTIKKLISPSFPLVKKPLPQRGKSQKIIELAANFKLTKITKDRRAMLKFYPVA
jgi:hypothetical protein